MTEQLDSPEGDLTALIAMTPSGVIGRDGEMPWRLSSDLRRFKQLTMGGVLVMGRKTFDSIGRPLPGRRSIVITGNPGWSVPGVERAGSPEESLQLARNASSPEDSPSSPGDSSTADSLQGGPRVFVVGGAEIYRQLLPRCKYLFLTRVWSGVDGDTKLQIDLSPFRVIEQTRVPASAQDDVPSEFLRLVRRDSSEK